MQKTQPVYENVVYLYLIDEKEKTEKLYRELMKQPWISEFRVAFHDSVKHKGYANIKIYQKDATRENMLQNLKALLNVEKVVTFGSVEGKYDVYVKDADKDVMVKMLKKIYEPLRIPKNAE